MKKLLYNRFFPMKMAFVLSFSLGSYSSSAQQDTAFSNEITAAIAANRWVFNAQRSDPPIGRSSMLSTGYEVVCKGDTVVFVLPYAGTMQGPARFPESKGPLDFTSTSFAISKKDKGNGKWILTLRPKDHYDVASCTFTFFDDGTATLDVMMTNRSPIDFYGTVEPLK